MTTEEDVFLATAPHVAPELTPESRDFWTGGKLGELRIYQCNRCATFLHPPSPVCRSCRSMDVAPRSVSGKATLVAFTVNYHKWFADFDGPYVGGIVDLDDCPGVRLTTNIVGCRISEIKNGMPLRVGFHELDETWIPIFRPDHL